MGRGLLPLCRARAEQWQTATRAALFSPPPAPSPPVTMWTGIVSICRPPWESNSRYPSSRRLPVSLCQTLRSAEARPFLGLLRPLSFEHSLTAPRGDFYSGDDRSCNRLRLLWARLAWPVPPGIINHHTIEGLVPVNRCADCRIFG